METRKTILVVDDTPDIAHLLREVLELDGHRVLVAPTADIGMQILRCPGYFSHPRGSWPCRVVCAGRRGR